MTNDFIAVFVVVFVQVMVAIIFLRIILDWMVVLAGFQRNNPLYVVAHQLTEPMLGPIRGLMSKILPGALGMIDLSPIIAILLLQALAWLVNGNLRS